MNAVIMTLCVAGRRLQPFHGQQTRLALAEVDRDFLDQLQGPECASLCAVGRTDNIYE